MILLLYTVALANDPVTTATNGLIEGPTALFVDPARLRRELRPASGVGVGAIDPTVFASGQGDDRAWALGFREDVDLDYLRSEMPSGGARTRDLSARLGFGAGYAVGRVGLSVEGTYSGARRTLTGPVNNPQYGPNAYPDSGLGMQGGQRDRTWDLRLSAGRATLEGEARPWSTGFLRVRRSLSRMDYRVGGVRNDGEVGNPSDRWTGAGGAYSLPSVGPPIVGSVPAGTVYARGNYLVPELGARLGRDRGGTPLDPERRLYGQLSAGLVRPALDEGRIVYGRLPEEPVDLVQVKDAGGMIASAQLGGFRRFGDLASGRIRVGMVGDLGVARARFDAIVQDATPGASTTIVTDPNRVRTPTQAIRGSGGVHVPVALEQPLGEAFTLRAAVWADGRAYGRFDATGGPQANRNGTSAIDLSTGGGAVLGLNWQAVEQVGLHLQLPVTPVISSTGWVPTPTLWIVGTPRASTPSG